MHPINKKNINLTTSTSHFKYKIKIRGISHLQTSDSFCANGSLYSFDYLQLLTFPSSYHRRAWLRDRTLQSKMALLAVGRALATDRPIFTGSTSDTCLSRNGCELARQVNTAKADMLLVPPLPHRTFLALITSHGQSLGVTQVQPYTSLYLHNKKWHIVQVYISFN